MDRRNFLTAMSAAGAGTALAAADDSHLVTPIRTPGAGIVDIGSTRQQFLDDDLIASRNRVSRFMPRPRKEGVVIAADQPWELENAQAGGYPFTGVQISGQAVLFDEDEQLFKMWYNPWAFFNDRLRPWCYAVSMDGFHWEKPKLGICDFHGSRENNILWAKSGTKYFNVIKDPRDPDPRRRYKAMGENEVRGNSGAAVAFSPDGLHWTEHPGNPVARKGRDIADSPMLFGWDDRIQKYVYYPRPGPPLATRLNARGYHEAPDRVNLNEGQLRTIGYSTSDDFVNWSPTEIMLAPDEHDRVDFQYYQMTAARDGDHYIGLMHMLQTHEQTFDIYLMTSRDGFHWNWVDRQIPFLRRGEIGDIDDGYLTPSGPIVQGDRTWIYYGAYSGAHSAEPSPLGVDTMTIALATLPVNRYVGVLAGPDVGTVVTRPLTFRGSRLQIDFDASLPGKASGSLTQRRFDEADVRVAIVDEWGGPIPGLGIEQSTLMFGRGVQEAHWEGADLSGAQGKPIRLRFEFRNAALYGFQFV